MSPANPPFFLFLCQFMGFPGCASWIKWTRAGIWGKGISLCRSCKCYLYRCAYFFTSCRKFDLIRRARTRCLIYGENIQVGKRSIHLVEKHWNSLIEFSECSKQSERFFAKWLEKHSLYEDSRTIADAMKKDRKVRLPFSYLSHFFDFPSHTSARWAKTRYDVCWAVFERVWEKRIINGLVTLLWFFLQDFSTAEYGSISACYDGVSLWQNLEQLA